MRSTTLILFLINLVYVNIAFSQDYTCGIAIGFPPYQFQINDQAAGFDVDVAQLISKKMDLEFSFSQDNWDHTVAKLRFHKIDFIAGMEATGIRRKLFDFTVPYYYRYDVIFIKKNDGEINKVEDLFNRIISGDRHSYVEEYLKKRGIKNKIRILQTESKEKSMQMLGSGKIRAAIMPKAVGFYLAKRIGLDVKILIAPDPGSPVVFAVKKGNHKLLQQLDTALRELIKSGDIDKLYNDWF